MSLMNQKKKLEDKIKQLEQQKIEYSEKKKDLAKSGECEKIREDIKRLEREIAELEMQLKVNAAMLEYSQKKGDTGNDSLCLSLKNQAAIILYSNFESLIYTASRYYAGRGTREDCEDAVHTALCESFEKYDSQRNDNFCAYFYKCLKFAVQNALRKVYIDTKKKKATPSDENTENAGRYKKRWQSVDSLTGSQDKPSYPPVIDPSPTPEERIVNRMTLEEFYCKMAVCVIKISGRTGNPDKFFRTFATEHYIMLCRMHLHDICDINEHEAFKVMDLVFADFTLTAKCRSFIGMEITPCKTYVEIGLNGEDELDIPFEPKVYKIYHGVSSGRITQKRNEFNEKLGIPRHERR